MRSSYAPNPRSAQAVTIIVSPAPGRAGAFDARVGDRLTVARVKTPLLEAARELLALGADPRAILVMKHAGSQVVALRATLRVAAGLSVRDRDRGRPVFEPWRAMPVSSPVAPPIAPAGRAGTEGHRHRFERAHDGAGVGTVS